MQFEFVYLQNPLDKAHPHFESFRKLHAEIFSEKYTQELLDQLESKPNMLLVIAFHNKSVLGFKLGYEVDNQTFYSWTGAVATNARKLGVATKLMHAQHDWCRSKGYKKVRTKTKNKWREMLSLNIRHGFDVIETYKDTANEIKIVLEKTL